jgi:hypothetical protein
MSNMLDKVTSAMIDNDMGDVTKLLDKGLEIVTTSEECTDIEGLPEAQKAAEEQKVGKAQEVVSHSYAEIKQIAMKVNDPEFLRSGLRKAIGGPDCSIEYVVPRAVPLYTAEGETCIGLTRDEVNRRIHQLNLDRNADSANVKEDIGGLHEDDQNAEDTEERGGGEPASSNRKSSYVSQTYYNEEDKEYEA